MPPQPFYLNHNQPGFQIPFPPAPPHQNVGQNIYGLRGPPPIPNYQWPHHHPPYGQPQPPPAIPTPRHRQQSQVIRVGNMLRVLPAELPTAPITITCSTPFGDNTILNGHINQQVVPKRVVTIKVPVVPFSVPVVQPHSGLTDEERAARRKRRREKQKRLEEEKAKAAKVAQDATKQEPEDEVSPEELALLKVGPTATWTLDSNNLVAIAILLLITRLTTNIVNETSTVVSILIHRRRYIYC